MQRQLVFTYLDQRHIPVAQDTSANGFHQRLCTVAPSFAVALLADQHAHISHKRAVLANLLRHSVDTPITRQHIATRLRALPGLEALELIEVVRLQRMNHRRARKLGLDVLIGHGDFSELAATRRQRLIRLLRHLLGERTWSTVCRVLAGDPQHELHISLHKGEEFVQGLLDYAMEGAVAHEALNFLAGVTLNPAHPTLKKRVAAELDIRQGEGLPRETLFGLRGTHHKAVAASEVRYLAAVQTDQGQRDGSLTALYKRVFIQGNAVAVDQFLQERDALLRQALAHLPVVPARLAIVLDLSASTASSGERAYHLAALSLAITTLLYACVREVLIQQVGGSMLFEEQPFTLPQGTTDLASAVLNAAQQQPQAILVMTDGYENARQGDTAIVVQAMRQFGLTMPVWQVVPLFAASEDLTRRQLGAELPLLSIEHESAVGALLTRILLTVSNETLSDTQVQIIQDLLFGRGNI